MAMAYNIQSQVRKRNSADLYLLVVRDTVCMCELTLNGASTTKGLWRLDAVEGSLDVDSLRSWSESVRDKLF